MEQSEIGIQARRDMVRRNIIFKAEAGSWLYGTNGVNSDTDYLGCFLPDREYVVGFDVFEQEITRTNPSDSKTPNTSVDMDSTIYSLPKLFYLLSRNNPTAIEMLFVPEASAIVTSKTWQQILEKKQLFLSKQSKLSFLGYAFQQKSKVLNKKDRYSQFLEALDTVETYMRCGHTSLPEQLKLNTDLVQSGFWKKFEKGRTIADVRDNICAEIEKYGLHIDNVRNYGFDSKFVAHTYRLLSEGIELLQTGQIVFPLKEAERIKAIKNYQLPLADCFKLINELEKKIEVVYCESKLPYEPNKKAISNLQVAILFDFWNKQDNRSYEPKQGSHD